MGYFGDYDAVVVCHAPPDIIVSAMATALLFIYTPEGFVIASDKRKGRSNGPPVSDDSQKIFSIQGQTLIYALAGTVQITKDETAEEIGFDFLTETESAVQVAMARDPFSLKKYARLVCSQIRAALEESKLSGRVVVYPNDPVAPSDAGVHTIAYLFLCGYYKQIALLVHAKFAHKEQELCEPEIVGISPPLGVIRGYCSEPIGELLGGAKEDRRFAPYRDGIASDERTLLDGIELAKNYFRACTDPEIQKLDERHCMSLSPTFHIATITLADGVKWVPGFGPTPQTKASL